MKNKGNSTLTTGSETGRKDPSTSRPTGRLCQHLQMQMQNSPLPTLQWGRGHQQMAEHRCMGLLLLLLSRWWWTEHVLGAVVDSLGGGWTGTESTSSSEKGPC